MSQTILKRPYLTSPEELACLENLSLPNSDSDTDDDNWKTVAVHALSTHLYQLEKSPRPKF